ncbi:hypothetical protein CIG75_05055 [Tumebacillus algifaecis]|uniref:Uncharacterized protein n=1 Tax=Tumebacillus algifaecis TaxID=1214604 RepID=A0A223CZ16_9BACL|nr:hypothetical protein CIG75_05055 [Tumebacillus algifaecis]
MALDEPRADDEVIDAGDNIQVVVDRGSWFFVDEPLKIDYEPAEKAFRIRAATHVIPDRIKL